MATIITSDLDVVTAAYEKSLGYKTIDQSTISEELALHWGQLELADRKSAVMAPASDARVFLRFIELPDAQKPELGPGWFALEICVSDVEALYQTLLDSNDFKPFAVPKPMAFTDAVYPMQCQGPAGEILYLNQVKSSLPDIDLPIAQSEVDHLFISILGAGDMEVSIAFYESLLDMAVNERHEIAYKTINRVYGFPLETQHKLSTLGKPREVALEIDQAPSGYSRNDELAEGVLMVSFTTDKIPLDRSKTLGLPKRLNDPPYNGALSAIYQGPDGEKIELIQLS